MQIPEYSDNLIKVSGPNGKDSPCVYWFAHYISSGIFVTVGTFTAYGFVWSQEPSVQELISFSAVKKAVLDRVELLRNGGKHCMPKRGAPRYVLKKCRFPDSFRKKYRAMENAYFSGNRNFRVSMQTGQIVFANSSYGKFLSHENEATCAAQLKEHGIDENATGKTFRTKPRKLVKPIVVRLPANTASFYF